MLDQALPFQCRVMPDGPTAQTSLAPLPHTAKKSGDVPIETFDHTLPFQCLLSGATRHAAEAAGPSPARLHLYPRGQHRSALRVGAPRKECVGVPAQGSVTTSDPELMRLLAQAGVGLLYAFEPMIADELRRGSLRLVLEPYAAAVPGLFLYFPSRAQVSPALCRS